MSSITGGSVAQDIINKNKAKPDAEEHRTKRVQIVLTPSLYEALVETRYKNKITSVNETIVQAITEYIERSK